MQTQAQDQKIKAKEFNLWLENPITRTLIEVIEEHSEASKKFVAECMLYSHDVGTANLYEIAEYKGQFNALETVKDLKEFMRERVEIPKEEINND